MDYDKAIDSFFIENEDKFTEEQLLKSINILKKYAKLVGREGRVHIENRNISGTDKLKLFLVTRYLGSELSKVKVELKIDPNIRTINVNDVTSFLSVDKPNARARMSALVKEGFAKRPVKGKIEVETFQVERFINQLEEGDKKETQKNEGKSKKRHPTKPKKQVKKLKEQTKDKKEVYETLSKDLGINIDKLIDAIYIREDGFKFNRIFGDSRHAKQKSCLLMSAYIYLIGFENETFESKTIKDICRHSLVDPTALNDAIKRLKRKGMISKTEKGSQTNYILEKGKEIAREELKKLCEG